MSSDPIADMLTQIKNGYLARKKSVSIPFSKMKEEISRILVKEGYIASFLTKEEKLKTKIIYITLKYEGKIPVLTEIKRISKPGLRVYKDKHNLPKVLSGLGIAIISTSRGLMTEKEAKKQNLGGEIICKLW